LDALWEKADLLERFTGARGDASIEKFSRASYSESDGPDGDDGSLSAESPRLLQLRSEYESAQHPATRTGLWTADYVHDELDFSHFRGDNAFLYQFRDLNLESAYLLAGYYIQKIDTHNLLRRMKEDGRFGAYLFHLDDDLALSRDLIDSIIEIYFLDRHLEIMSRHNLRILDIGAGYGRLAHRMAESVPGLEQYICVDAVPESTFLSEWYLRFRQVDDRAKVVPLTEIDDVLSTQQIDLAVNIHSFSECTRETIEWWLDLVRRHNIRDLMIVPNIGDHGGSKLVSHEADGQHLDFLSAVEARGYELVTQEPKYLDSGLQRLGVSPTHYFLFRLGA
jgi:hypothetical protein